MNGVFIAKGMTLTIPAGGLTLSIGDDGKLKGSNLTLHLQYDVCPTWLELASRHLTDADHRRLARIVAWQADDAGARAATLEREFESSMQAMMAAAIALDSFYLALRDKTSIPKETIQTWRKKRTARYKQVAEVLRRAFALPDRGSVVLRGNLKEIFKFRDLAVHPSAAATEPVFHPELHTSVEWRFAAFRTENARAAVRAARSIIHELVTKGSPTTPEIARYAEGLRNQLAVSESTNSGS